MRDALSSRKVSCRLVSPGTSTSERASGASEKADENRG